jgi:hypothetical protein
MHLLIDSVGESDGNNIIIGVKVKDEIKPGTSIMTNTISGQNGNKYSKFKQIVRYMKNIKFIQMMSPKILNLQMESKLLINI